MGLQRVTNLVRYISSRLSSAVQSLGSSLRVDAGFCHVKSVTAMVGTCVKLTPSNLFFRSEAACRLLCNSQVGVLRRGKYFKGKKVGKGNAVNEVSLSAQLRSFSSNMLFLFSHAF